MRQLAVTGIAPCAEIHIAVRGTVSVALFLQGADDVDDLVDLLRGTRMHSRFAHAETLGVHLELGNVPFRNRFVIDAFFVGATNDLVVDVGEILNETNLPAAPLQIPTQHIEHAQRTRVADVNVVIHRRAAGIHANHTRLQCNQLFLVTRHRIINFHHSVSFA